jgi:hypothetical protein
MEADHLLLDLLFEQVGLSDLTTLSLTCKHLQERYIQLFTNDCVLIDNINFNLATLARQHLENSSTPREVRRACNVFRILLQRINLKIDNRQDTMWLHQHNNSPANPQRTHRGRELLRCPSAKRILILLRQPTTEWTYVYCNVKVLLNDQEHYNMFVDQWTAPWPQENF